MKKCRTEDMIRTEGTDITTNMTDLQGLRTVEVGAVEALTEMHEGAREDRVMKPEGEPLHKPREEPRKDAGSSCLFLSLSYY